MQLLIYLLPFTLLLACPLLMVFMMRGMHSGHGGHGAPDAHGADASHAGSGHAAVDDNRAASDAPARLQAMEQEIAALRREQGGNGARDAARRVDGAGR